MSDDLKPCPFCGGEATIYHRDDTSGFSNEDWISCDGECGASTCLHETPALAISAWNTRHKPLAEQLFDQQISDYVKRGKP